jgi:hypothetical protein
MKAILQFSLPEEQSEFNEAVNGSKFQSALQGIDEACRNWLKHGHEFEDTADALQAVRDMIPQDIYE